PSQRAPCGNAAPAGTATEGESRMDLVYPSRASPRRRTMSDLRARLYGLSQNLWWSWSYELQSVFRAIDAELWREVNHNPIAFLKRIDAETLARASADARIVAQTIRAEKHLQDYLASDSHWTNWNAPGLVSFPVAYFSFEFCVHESLPIYSGGLGVLAGDHLKSCSDLGVPADGVTLLYRQGSLPPPPDPPPNPRADFPQTA